MVFLRESFVFNFSFLIFHYYEWFILKNKKKRSWLPACG